MNEKPETQREATQPQTPTEEKLVELEAMMLAQEHRWGHIVFNFLWNRNQWKEGDPRRKATLRAFVWRFLTPASAAVVGGGIVAGLTLVFLGLQTKLMSEQNSLILDQNKYFRDQIAEMKEQNKIQELQGRNANAQADLQRRTQLIACLYETNASGALANRRVREEAVAEFLAMDRPSSGIISLEGALLDGTQHHQRIFRKVSFDGATMDQAYFWECVFDSVKLNFFTPGSPNFQRCVFIHSGIPRNSQLVWKSIFVQTLDEPVNGEFTGHMGNSVLTNNTLLSNVPKDISSLSPKLLVALSMLVAESEFPESRDLPGTFKVRNQPQLINWMAHYRVTNWPIFVGALSNKVPQLYKWPQN